MTLTEILHDLLRGMDPYLSQGVPTIYWALALKLTEHDSARSYARRKSFGFRELPLHEDTNVL